MNGPLKGLSADPLVLGKPSVGPLKGRVAYPLVQGKPSVNSASSVNSNQKSLYNKLDFAKIKDRSRSPQRGTPNSPFESEPLQAAQGPTKGAPNDPSRTIRPNEALDSTDRSVVAALLSTSARPVNKSSVNESKPQRCSGKVMFQFPWDASVPGEYFFLGFTKLRGPKTK